MLKGYQGYLNTIDFGPDGKRVVTASEDGTAQVWSTTGAGQPKVLRGHSGHVISASFSVDGEHIVTVSTDGTARIWSANGHAESVVLRSDTGPVRSASFSKDGNRVVTAAGRIIIWTLDGHPSPAVLGDDTRPADFAEFSPDGTRVLTVSGNSAFVWNTDGRAAPVELKSEGKYPLRNASFSTDGRQVIGCSSDGATIWRADGRGQPVVLPFQLRGGNNLHFSPDGRRILDIGEDGGYIWRTDGQSDPLFLEQSKEAVDDGVFGADGKSVAGWKKIGGYTAMFWNATRPSLPLVLSGQRGSVTGVVISPDGRWVGTAHSDGTARVWSVDWQELMKYVAARVAQTRVCLDSAQRIQYLGEEAAQAQSHFQACESGFSRAKIDPSAPVPPSHLEQPIRRAKLEQFAYKEAN